MPLLFSIHSIPELAHVPTEERGRLVCESSLRAKPDMRHALVVGGRVSLLAGVWGYVVSRPGLRGVEQLVVSLVAGVVYWLILVNLTYLRVRSLLRDELRARARCTSCGFDLRASPERCPECGMAAAGR